MTSKTAKRKARRRAIAREWMVYLGVKIRARDVKIMQRLADDVGDELSRGPEDGAL